MDPAVWLPEWAAGRLTRRGREFSFFATMGNYLVIIGAAATIMTSWALCLSARRLAQIASKRAAASLSRAARAGSQALALREAEQIGSAAKRGERLSGGSARRLSGGVY